MVIQVTTYTWLDHMRQQQQWEQVENFELTINMIEQDSNEDLATKAFEQYSKASYQ
jgi:hypothetical protein